MTDIRRSLRAAATLFAMVAGLASAETPVIISREVGAAKPNHHLALYAEAQGGRLLAHNYVSEDNGKNWKIFQGTPNFAAGLPYGYRRSPNTGVLDPATGRLLLMINALDTPGLDPKTNEPPIAQNEYYIRYRVSADGGRTWLFDEPVIQAGLTEKNPIDGVWRGKNGVYLGDCGSIPVVTRTGHILLPVQMAVLGEDGAPYNPVKAPSYTEVVVLRGSWKDDAHLEWTASNHVKTSLEHSTRGMIEPTLAQFPDGRLLMVMRGSNVRKPELPAYKWYSISHDDGATWSEPKPWTYEEGTPFFSPSSMSILIRHSTGRVFWSGNVPPENANGNDPRLPLVLGEVDAKTLLLKRDSVIELDTRHAEDSARGEELLKDAHAKLDLSHAWVREDRETNDLVISYPRAFGAYKKMDWATVRVAVAKK
jgi:hypothetical protein